MCPRLAIAIVMINNKKFFLKKYNFKFKIMITKRKRRMPGSFLLEIVSNKRFNKEISELDSN